MRVRLINRRENDAVALQSNHDNIFSEVSDHSAPRGIPARIAPVEAAKVLRPDAFQIASNKRVANTSPEQLRGVPCFHGGSEVITQQGAKSICDLTTDDKVLTRDNGFQPVLWVGHVTSSKAIPMTVKIKQDAIMAGRPGDTIYVSGRQSLLLSCPEVQSQFGSAEVLARAGDLLHLDGISRADSMDNAVAVMTLQHELLNIGGLWMDSLVPDAEALNHLPSADKNAIKTLLPELRTLPVERSYPAARTLLRSEFARQFAR